MECTPVKSNLTGKLLFFSLRFNVRLNSINTGLGFDIPENITDRVFIGFNPFATLPEAKTDCIESFNSSIHTPIEPELEKVERILRHEKRHLKYWWTGYKRFKYADFFI